MRLINTNPIGESQIIRDGAVVPLEAGEEFEVPDAYGLVLLEQAGNFAVPHGAKDPLGGFTVEQLLTVASGRGIYPDPEAKKAEIVKAVTVHATAPAPAKEED